MRLRLLALFTLVLLRPEGALAQCAMCRDAAASSSPETREALNYAVIALALTPYVVAFLAAWLLSPGFRARLRRVLRLSAREPLGSEA